MSHDSTPAPEGAKLIHVHQINGRPVRFFLPPNGSVDFPWTSYEDFLSATGMSRSARRQFLTMTRKGPFVDALRQVKVSGGETTIVPHYICQGTMGALERDGTLPERFEAQYTIGSGEAFNIVHSASGPGGMMKALMQVMSHIREDRELLEADDAEGDVA